MKISLNWLKDYIHIEESAETLGHILTDTGLEVEGIESIDMVKGGLKGLVIGEVISCEKHPNADKLKVTSVDIGAGAPSPVVCGAPNVAKGQKVVVATPGTMLYPSGRDPFTIKKAKIRGEASEGMICAEDEIGLGHNHEGIMVLKTNLPNGTPVAAYFNLQSDQVFEIGLTPNRADATSHIGVARDLKAALNRPVNWPVVNHFKIDNTNKVINIEIENTDACPRYSGITVSNVNVTDSPEWMQQKLKAIGLAPINNIVDITNYILHEMGQPMHAFDADKIKGGKIIVKTLPEDTKFITLDEKERKLTKADLMICNGEEEGMCIAGVFGGIGSGVTKNTVNVFLESAYFSADYVRKTAQHHQLKTDASFRYERGTDPNITVYALKRAALLIKELAGGEISSEIIDIYPTPVKHFDITVKYRNIKRLIGKELEKQHIHQILNDLDIEIRNTSEESFTAIVPPYRVDVQREADVIEEVLRIYGFNNVDLPDFVRSNYLAEFPALNRDSIQKTVAELLAGNGYYEIITNSLTKPTYAIDDEHLNENESVQILNKLSEDLGVMRQNMLYSGLEVVLYNVNRKQTNLKFFEFGKNYFKKNGKYIEDRRLVIYLTGNIDGENWINKTRKVHFHDLSSIVNLISNRLISIPTSSSVSHDLPFEYALKKLIYEKELVTFGKVDEEIQLKTGLKQEIFYADFNWDLLLNFTSNNIVYEEVSKFPEVRRDLSLVIDDNVSFEQIKNLALKIEKQLIRSIDVFDVYQGDKIDKNKKAYAISFILQDKEKTLTDKVIDKTMNKLITSFEKDLEAIIRK